MKKIIFSDFLEYWRYAKCMSETQKGVLYNSLSQEQKEIINDSFSSQGWMDVFRINAIDKVIDDLNKQYGLNLIDIRAKVIKGKSVYLPKKLWEAVLFKFKDHNFNGKLPIFCGIKAQVCKENPEVVLLLKESSEEKS